MRADIIIFILIGIIIILVIALRVIRSENNETDAGAHEKRLPDTHTIAYDEASDTLDKEAGADVFAHQLDHPQSRYYVPNDYFNMTSNNGLHIITGFETFQQTSDYSCGCACALMVLNHYGVHEYKEADISRIAGTDTSTGTTVEGLAGFFETVGWNTIYNADSKKYCFESEEECEEYFISLLD